VSGSWDNSIKVWHLPSPKDHVAADKSAFSEKAGMEQRVGQFLVTAKDNLLLVHDANGAANSGEKQPVAFFSAPAPIVTIDCAGDKIGVRCSTGAVLLLQAAWLTMTS
jgi:hypothetical protein